MSKILTIPFILLIVSAISIAILLIYILRIKNKNKLQKIFGLNLICVLTISVGVILQTILSEFLNVDPYIFENYIYIGTCFLPVFLFLTGKTISNNDITFSKKYLLLFIVPILSLIILWTNKFHNLFYVDYEYVDLAKTTYGPYFTIHTLYTYGLLILGIFIILKHTFKSSGFFSKQSLLIVLGCSFPLITNILGTFKIIPMSIYITPISFAFTMLCFALAIFKFQFLGVAPIALQIVVNQISDSYVVLGIYNNIVDFNETFLKTFKLKQKNLRNMNFRDLLENIDTPDPDINTIMESIKKVSEKNKIFHFEQNFTKINRIFEIEVTPITANGTSLGTLFLFKDVTQHKRDMQTIKDNQDLLIERERLASLGQLIGGIAHNLKTPIMSIAGASEGIKDLVNEFDASIGNPVVEENDFHDIAKDMREWLTKINSYTEYMSDILTAVKGQAVALSEQSDMDFTLGELFKRVDILMKHELKQAVVYLNMSMKIDENIVINGDVNSLVQVINNMISNSIQAYDGKPDQKIDLIAWKNDNNNIVISIKDYGPGLPETVQKKLFKEMITTKGKNGTGLGLYMSYSTVKAHFNGDITVETEVGKGTVFNIILP